VAAYDKADDFKNDHAKTNGIVDFILLFGKVVYAKPKEHRSKKLPNDIPGLAVKLPSAASMHPHQKKTVVGNIIVDYARAMRKLKKHYNFGISKYVMLRLDNAVKSGKSDSLAHMVRTHDGAPMIGYSHKALGLTTRPRYFEKLAVPLTMYRTKAHEVMKQTRNADTAAAAMWLHSGEKGAYQSFMHREISKINVKRKIYNTKTLSTIRNYVADAFKKARSSRNSKMLPSKVAGASLRFADSEKIKSFKSPGNNAIRKLAKQAAAVWRKANKAKAAVIEEIKKIERISCPMLRCMVPAYKCPQGSRFGRPVNEDGCKGCTTCVDHNKKPVKIPTCYRSRIACARMLCRKGYKSVVKKRKGRNGASPCCTSYKCVNKQKPKVCPKPNTKQAPAGFKVVGCGDCDNTYTPIRNRKLIGLAACARECKNRNCRSFSYGTKNAEGGPGLGCRIGKGSKKCPISTKRYCSSSYALSKVKKWGGDKSCCGSTQCGKINYWGGLIYEPTAKRGPHVGSGVYLFPGIPSKWKLVRHVKAGNHWHPAVDQMRGTQAYGRYVTDNDGKPDMQSTFSIKFSHMLCSEYLFMTGDMKNWLITKKSQVLGWYANQHRRIERSSMKNHPYSARWYRRVNAREDPWVSLIDHHPAIGQGKILYGENNFGHTHALTVLPRSKHNGASVFCKV
jgi:hypothetical protein